MGNSRCRILPGEPQEPFFSVRTLMTRWNVSDEAGEIRPIYTAWRTRAPHLSKYPWSAVNDRTKVLSLCLRLLPSLSRIRRSAKRRSIGSVWNVTSRVLLNDALGRVTRAPNRCARLWLAHIVALRRRSRKYLAPYLARSAIHINASVRFDTSYQPESERIDRENNARYLGGTDILLKTTFDNFHFSETLLRE